MDFTRQDYTLCKTLVVTDANVLDDSPESQADRELLRSLSRQGVPCEAVGRFLVPGEHDTEPAPWLNEHGFTRDNASEANPPFPAEIKDGVLRCTAAEVPVTLFRGKTTRPNAQSAEEPGKFLQLLDAVFTRTHPAVVLARFGPSMPDVLAAARLRGIATIAYQLDGTLRDPALVRDASVVVVQSRLVADYLREAFGLPCVTLTPVLACTRSTQPPKPGSVVFDGTAPGSGLLVFAQLAEELAKRRPALPITVIGATGTVPIPTGGTIRCIPRTEAATAWAEAAVCVAPHLTWEHSPAGALHAIAHGVPVVASDRGASGELLGEAAVLLPLPERITTAYSDRLQPAEMAPWVDALLRFYDDAAFASRQRELAVLAQQRMSADELAPVYARFICEVVNRQPRARSSRIFSANGHAHTDERSQLQKLAENNTWPAEQPADAAPGKEQGWLGAGSDVMLTRSMTPKTKLVVELGAWLGLSTRYIADNAPHATVISVDHWQGSPEHKTQEHYRALLPRLYETFMARCWDYRERIVPLRMSSLEGLQRVADAGLQPDFVYVDAEHSYEAVTAELSLARKLFPHALLGGDDYDWTGVRQAVDEFARKNNLLVDRYGTRGWRLLENWQVSELSAIPPGRGQMAVLVPHLNGIEWECEQALRQLEQAGVRVIRRGGCSAIDVARNELLSGALHDGAESMLFIDADIGFEPVDALRLLARPEPVISAVYPKKSMREMASIFYDGVKELLFGPDTPGVYPLKYAATGFLCLKASLLRRMITQLQMPLCNTHWGRGVWPFFQPLIVPHGPGKWHYLAEDWAFSYRLTQMHVTPLADTSIRLWHWGRYGFGWEDAGTSTQRFRSYTYRLAPT
jgi:predicted O-methyltransferase YrrM